MAPVVVDSYERSLFNGNAKSHNLLPTGWHKLWQSGKQFVSIFPIFEDFFWSQKVKMRPAIEGEKAVLSRHL